MCARLLLLAGDRALGLLTFHSVLFCKRTNFHTPRNFRSLRRHRVVVVVAVVVARTLANKYLILCHR